MRPILLALFAASMGLVGACSGTHESLHDRAVPSVTLVPTVPVLNVPSLLSLSIDEMSRRVGPPMPVPSDFTDPTLTLLTQRNESMDSTSLFRYRSLAMVAAYDYHSRRISDLLLLGADENVLMRRAQLQLGAPKYLVLPVFQAHQPTRLLGLRVLATTLNN